MDKKITFNILVTHKDNGAVGTTDIIVDTDFILLPNIFKEVDLMTLATTRIDCNKLETGNYEIVFIGHFLQDKSITGKFIYTISGEEFLSFGKNFDIMLKNNILEMTIVKHVLQNYDPIFLINVKDRKMFVE